jgi:hypothetical protein
MELYHHPKTPSWQAQGQLTIARAVFRVVPDVIYGANMGFPNRSVHQYPKNSNNLSPPRDVSLAHINFPENYN